MLSDDFIADYEAAVRKYISGANFANSVSQDQFDALAKFVVVADELSHEPFFSEDNHDRLDNRADLPSGFLGDFSHPAFLKSAILPFRKLWMTSEPCNYERVRDIVFGLFIGKQEILGYRYWFYDDHTNSLKRQIDGVAKIRSFADVLDVWINTQGVHTGKKNLKKQKSGKEYQGNFTLADFDEINRQVGRAKFEFEFRGAMRVVGSIYLNFFKTLARPTFDRLCTLGHAPGFEVEAAFRFSPYPQEDDNIRLSDCFWHLDKETPEQTFDRLLERHEFNEFDIFFHGYFDARRPALESLIEYETLDILISGTRGTVLNEKQDRDRPMSCFFATGDFNANDGRITVFEGKKVLFEERSRYFLGLLYRKFRKAYLDHRQKIPERDNKSKWTGNWQGW